MSGPRRWSLDGVIAAAGFASGDRIVVGHWWSSPIGPLTDVMWATATGERVLLSPDDRASAFIEAVYRFDRVEVVPFDDVAGGERFVRLRAGDLAVEMTAGAGWRVPGSSAAWFVRGVQGPVARVAMGVRTYGVSPTGVREWYRASVWRPVTFARASVAGTDLGPVRPVDPPLAVGVSEPPRRPSIVRVSPLLEDPSGRLDEVVAELL